MSKSLMKGLFGVSISKAKSEPKALSQQYDQLFIEGIATSDIIDAEGEVIARTCYPRFIKNVEDRVKSGKPLPLFVEHRRDGAGHSLPVGGVVEAKEDPRGLWFKAFIAQGPTGSVPDLVQQLVKQGVLYSVSIGGDALKHTPSIDPKTGKNIKKIVDAEWRELSLTGLPVNETAVFSIAKSKTFKGNVKEVENTVKKLIKALDAEKSGTRYSSTIKSIAKAAQVLTDEVKKADQPAEDFSGQDLKNLQDALNQIAQIFGLGSLEGAAGQSGMEEAGSTPDEKAPAASTEVAPEPQEAPTEEPSSTPEAPVEEVEAEETEEETTEPEEEKSEVIPETDEAEKGFELPKGNIEEKLDRILEALGEKGAEKSEEADLEEKSEDEEETETESTDEDEDKDEDVNENLTEFKKKTMGGEQFMKKSALDAILDIVKSQEFEAKDEEYEDEGDNEYEDDEEEEVEMKKSQISKSTLSCSGCRSEFAKSDKGDEYDINFCPSCGTKFDKDAVKNIAMAPKPKGAQAVDSPEEAKGKDYNNEVLGEKQDVIAIAPRPTGSTPKFENSKRRQSISKDIAISEGKGEGTGSSVQEYNKEGNYFPASDKEVSEEDGINTDVGEYGSQYYPGVESVKPELYAAYGQARLGKSQRPDVKGEAGMRVEKSKSVDELTALTNSVKQLAGQVVSMQKSMEDMPGRRSRVAFKKSQEAIVSFEKTADQQFANILTGRSK